MGWAGTEFETIELGDVRRNKRAIRLVECLKRSTHGERATSLWGLGRNHGCVPILRQRGGPLSSA